MNYRNEQDLTEWAQTPFSGLGAQLAAMQDPRYDDAVDDTYRNAVIAKMALSMDAPAVATRPTLTAGQGVYRHDIGAGLTLSGPNGAPAIRDAAAEKIETAREQFARIFGPLSIASEGPIGITASGKPLTDV